MSRAIERMKEIYREEHDNNPVFTLFVTVLLIGILVFAAAAIISNGVSVRSVLDAGEWMGTPMFFSDYFESIASSQEGTYSGWHSIYPPLATVFYKIIGSMVVPYVNYVPTDYSKDSLYSFMFAIRDSQLGMLSYFFVTLLTFYALHVIIKRLAKNTDLRVELLFLVILLSYPFIYSVERGNIVVLIAVFCFIFLMGHRSENKWIRYASYIALGCAAGFKLWPAIFALLILRDRNYREFAICTVIVSALIFVPFIFTDGTPMTLIDNILVFTSVSHTSSITNISQMVFGIGGNLGVSDGTSSVISNAIILTFTALSFIVILFAKDMKHWKLVALIACNLVLGFGVGTQYTPVYMVIPLIYFLVSEREMTKNNKFYLFCFIGILVLVPGFASDLNIAWSAIPTAKTLLIMAIAAAVICEGFGRIRKDYFGKKKLNPDTAAQ